MKIIPPHGLGPDNHLPQVIADMRLLGAPTIKAVWLEAYGAWLALEGSHRLVAALELGLTPELDAVNFDANATTDEIAPGSYQDTHTLGELADGAWRIKALTFPG